MGINLNYDQLNRVFPFHIEVNKHFEILSQGSSLTKIVGNLTNQKFNSFFQIERPHYDELSFDQIKKDKTNFFILKHLTQNFVFKGQLEFIVEKNTVIFFLTPYFHKIEDLKKNRLLLTDFANYDLTFDFLHIIKNIEINNDEIIDLVDQLKQKNNQISLQEEKHRNIIKNMNMGLIEVDNEDVLQFANQTFCEMSGYSLEELIGKSPTELLVEKQNHNIIRNKISIRKNGISDGFEIEIIKKNGKKRFWYISGAPNINDKGECIGSIGVHMDITEQKILEKELENAKLIAEKASKTKDMFLANMSHEIRTPLNVLIGMIRLIDKESKNENIKDYINQSNSAANHLLGILNDILDMSKIESGKMKINYLSMDIAAINKSIESIFKPSILSKGIVFRNSIDSNICLLKGDEIRLKQVLINLLSNSIKFTEKGFISTQIQLVNDSPESQTLRFIVEDSGIGMSTQFKETIFDKFSQESNQANRKYEGTGLGMAISKEILHLMKSELIIESKQGFGSKIQFDITFNKGEKIVNAKNLLKIKTKLLKGKQILLVEDNKINRLIVRKMLELSGCIVEEAENGNIAINKVINQKFDLILMDIQMPEMDGIEATKIIRTGLNLSTPILALTANSFQHDIDKYFDIGMNDFIIKPFEEDQFYAKIIKNI